MKKIISVICLIAILQGCVVFLGGAAIGAATASAVLYDQRKTKTIVSDENISYQVTQALQADHAIASQCHVGVTAYNQVVLLVGQAPTQELKDQISTAPKTVPGITKLYNEVTLEAPSTNLVQTSDTWVTTKVKSYLLAAKGLSSGQFKVVTENGTVYLMGLVTHGQADLAVEQARQVEGVQKVVTVFEYQHD